MYILNGLSVILSVMLNYFASLSFFLTVYLATSFSVHAMPSHSVHVSEPAMEAETRSSINDYDLKYQQMEWKVDPSINSISGKISSYIFILADLDMLEFNMSSALVFDSAYINAEKIMEYQQADDMLQLILPHTISAEQLDTIIIYYHGTPAESGFGSFVLDTHDSVPILWTLSEPYGAKDWWPCKQSLTDKIDSIDVFITSPNAYTAVSNGLLNDVVTVGDYTTWHWRHRHPIATYLVCMAVTNYQQYNDTITVGDENILVENYVYPEDIEEAQAGTAELAGPMQLFSQLFGLYPFANEKYGHAQCNFGGGMEHQTITFVGLWTYELLAHELAHHWFGDYVTCASWEDVWLNESFATYLSALCYEFLKPDEFQNFLYWRKVWAVSNPGGSVFCDDTTSVSRIFNGQLSYSKGALVLHQLRWVIGDDNFFTALQNYLDDPEIANGFATTKQLIAHFENVYGQPLDWYFNDWYYGEGYPMYDITWKQDAANVVTVVVSQSQSVNDIDFFELPIELQFSNGNYDTSVVVQNDYDGQVFIIPLDKPVNVLAFDPYQHLITNGNIIKGNLIECDEFIMNAFPVPATDNLSVTACGDAVYTLQLFDTGGKLIYTGTIQRYNALDVSGYASGVYILSLTDGNGKLVESKEIVLH